MSEEDSVKIAVLETKVDNIQVAVDNMPDKIAALIHDKIEISILQCAQSRDKSYWGVKGSHISADTISGFLIGIWEFIKFMGKK